ncbi:hypothetical protein T12_6520 [Trichinella patagoniensis]|uniref:Uncharacterized protein n=1 Tax=Trichinella patagoniensis TaxID=990121 RepID=A0A0V0ZD52_9BILA|nr:hypothetical protein T12_6520 [Trichinella patagoniensis]
MNVARLLNQFRRLQFSQIQHEVASQAFSHLYVKIDNLYILYIQPYTMFVALLFYIFMKKENHLGRHASVAGCVNDFLEKIPFTPILENWKSLKIGYSNLTKAID